MGFRSVDYSSTVSPVDTEEKPRPHQPEEEAYDLGGRDDAIYEAAQATAEDRDIPLYDAYKIELKRKDKVRYGTMKTGRTAKPLEWEEVPDAESKELPQSWAEIKNAAKRWGHAVSQMVEREGLEDLEAPAPEDKDAAWYNIIERTKDERRALAPVLQMLSKASAGEGIGPAGRAALMLTAPIENAVAVMSESDRQKIAAGIKDSTGSLYPYLDDAAGMATAALLAGADIKETPSRIFARGTRGFTPREGDVGYRSKAVREFIAGDTAAGLALESPSMWLLRVVSTVVPALVSETAYETEIKPAKSAPGKVAMDVTGLATGGMLGYAASKAVQYALKDTPEDSDELTLGEVLFGRWQDTGYAGDTYEGEGPALKGKALYRSSTQARNITGDYSNYSDIGKILMNSAEKVENGATFMNDFPAIARSRVHRRPTGVASDPNDVYRNVAYAIMPRWVEERQEEYEAAVKPIDYRQEMAATLMGVAGFGVDLLNWETAPLVPMKAVARAKKSAKLLQEQLDHLGVGDVNKASWWELLFTQDVDIAESTRKHLARAFADGKFETIEELPPGVRAYVESILQDELQMSFSEVAQAWSAVRAGAKTDEEAIKALQKRAETKRNIPKIEAQRLEGIRKAVNAVNEGSTPIGLQEIADRIIELSNGVRPKTVSEALLWVKRLTDEGMWVPEHLAEYLMINPAMRKLNTQRAPMYGIMSSGGEVHRGEFWEVVQEFLHISKMHREGKLSDDIASYSIVDLTNNRGTVVRWSKTGNSQDLTPKKGMQPKGSHQWVDEKTGAPIGKERPRRRRDYFGRKEGRLLKPAGRLTNDAHGDIRNLFASADEVLIIDALRTGDASILKGLSKGQKLLPDHMRNQGWVDAMRGQGIYLFGDVKAGKDSVEAVAKRMGYSLTTNEHTRGTGKLPWPGRVNVKRDAPVVPIEMKGVDDVAQVGNVSVSAKEFSEQVFQTLIAGNPPFRSVPALDTLSGWMVDVLVDAQKMYYRERVGTQKLVGMAGGLYVTPTEQGYLRRTVSSMFGEEGLSVDALKIDQKTGAATLTDKQVAGYNRLAKFAGQDGMRKLTVEDNVVSNKEFLGLNAAVVRRLAKRYQQQRYSLRATNDSAQAIVHALSTTIKRKRPDDRAWKTPFEWFFDADWETLPIATQDALNIMKRELSNNSRVVSQWINRHYTGSRWNKEFDVADALIELMPNYIPVSAGELAIIKRIEALEGADEVSILGLRDELLEYAKDFDEIAPTLTYQDGAAVLAELKVYAKERRRQMHRDVVHLMSAFVRDKGAVQEIRGALLHGTGGAGNKINWINKNAEQLYKDIIVDGNFGSSVFDDWAVNFPKTKIQPTGAAVLDFVLDKRADWIMNKHVRALADRGIGVMSVKSGDANTIGSGRVEDMVVKILKNEEQYQNEILGDMETYEQAMMIVRRMGLDGQEGRRYAEIGEWRVRTGLGSNAGVEAATLVLSEPLVKILKSAQARGKFSMSDMLGQHGISRFMSALHRWGKAAATSFNPVYLTMNMLTTPLILYRQLGPAQMTDTMKTILSNWQMTAALVGRLGKSGYKWQGKTLGAKVIKAPGNRYYHIDTIERELLKHGADVTMARAELQKGMVGGLLRQQSTLGKVYGTIEGGADALVDAAGELAHSADMMYRAATAISRIKKGDSVAEAARAARKSTFPWDEITSTEKEIFRWLFQWYAFIRKDSGALIREMINNPGRIAAEARSFRNMRSVWGEQGSDLHTDDPKELARITLPIAPMLKEDGTVDGRFRHVVAQTTPTGVYESTYSALSLLSLLDLFGVGPIPKERAINELSFLPKTIVGEVMGIDPDTGYGTDNWRANRVPSYLVPAYRQMFGYDAVLAKPVGGNINPNWVNAELNGRAAVYYINPDANFARVMNRSISSLGGDRLQNKTIDNFSNLFGHFLGGGESLRFTDEEGNLHLGSEGILSVIETVMPTDPKMTETERKKFWLQQQERAIRGKTRTETR